MLDEFLRKITKVKDDIDRLGSYTNKIAELYGKKLRDVLRGDEEKEISHQIEVVADLFRKQSHSVKAELEEINNQNAEIKKTQKESSLEYQSRNMHWQRCTKSLTTEINRFRQEQLKYAQDEKDKLKLQYVAINPKATDEEITKLLSTENSDAMLQEALAGGSESSRKQLELAKDRNTRIKSLTKRMEDLLELINDLQKMVNRSGAVVDKIEVNMEKTKETTQAANKDLEVAYRYQVNVMWLKRIIYGVILVVIGIGVLYVLLVFVPRFLPSRDNKNNNKNT
jgi:syntaxin 1B/2/3